MSVFDECQRWVETGVIPPEVNHTNLVLIPKCNNPEEMKDLRPISLCNVVYKIFTKVLANHLKVLLSDIVS